MRGNAVPFVVRSDKKGMCGNRSDGSVRYHET